MHLINKKLLRWAVFLALGLPLSYLFMTAEPIWALLALVGLGAIYVVLRPFHASMKVASILLVAYLAFAGLLNFSQPLFVDSWSIFTLLLAVSLFLQPVVLLLAIDSILDVIDKNKKLSDMIAVVLLWVGTLAIVFGSMAFMHTSNNQVPILFIIFLVPWLLNGGVFLTAALMLTFLIQKASKRKTAIKQHRRTK